jgi:hypothetical protein
MITLCHAAKGGSGTSVVAASRALGDNRPTLLVDFEGDAPVILGTSKPDRPGVVDWLASDAPGAHLADLVIDVSSTCSLLPAWATTTQPRPALTADVDRWTTLAVWLTTWAHDTGGQVVVDAGTSVVDPGFAEQCQRRWLVTRSCYLSLNHASHLTVRPTGVVLIAEPGRTLRQRDIETAAGAPVIATIDWDPRVSRAVDAGLLLTRSLPRAFHRAIARAAA